MKKYLLLLIVSLILFSCSNDNNNLSKEELILGKWLPIAEEGFCEGEEPERYPFTQCEIETSFVNFLENGTVIFRLDEECEGNISESTGTWRIENDNLYIDNEKVEYFTITSSTLKVGEIDNNSSCRNGAYYTVLIR